MMGKVREAVYSTLTSFGVYEYPVVRHLDLFAGSGSVGLESLSRGASHCTFCDLSSDCCSAIQRNIAWCHFDDEDDTDDDGAKKKSQDISGSATRVVCADVLQVLRNPQSVGIPVEHAATGIVGEKYDIVTICPPYEEVVYADLMEAAASSPLIKEDTILLVEYPVELWGDIPHVYTSNSSNGGDSAMARTLVGVRNRKYGRTVIAMYVCNPTGKVKNAESRPEEFI
jgi:16S rRNA (guanine966-N2)-methyltransferase